MLARNTIFREHQADETGDEMHTLVDFKGFAEASVNLLRPLTVLIGPNGSGKTNLIEAVELLAFIASGQPLHNVTDVGRGGGLEVRGGLQSCARRNATEFTLGFSAGSVKTQEPWHYKVTVRTTPTPEIQAESLQVGSRLAFEANRNETGFLVVGYGGSIHKLPSSSSVLSQYATMAASIDLSDDPFAAVAIRQRIHEHIYLSDSFRHNLLPPCVSDPNPRLMREYDRIGNIVLHRDGSNLSSVLYHLASTSNGMTTLQRITDRIRQLR
jgi:predicted ATPase